MLNYYPLFLISQIFLISLSDLANRSTQLVRWPLIPLSSKQFLHFTFKCNSSSTCFILWPDWMLLECRNPVIFTDQHKGHHRINNSMNGYTKRITKEEGRHKWCRDHITILSLECGLNVSFSLYIWHILHYWKWFA